MSGMNAGDIKPGPAGVSNVIYFDYDSFVVKPEFQSVLEAHARFMKANKNLRANLEGHTDERGGSEYNLALGQKRSEAVRRALTVLGISDSQMEAVSYGKEKPAAQGADEAAFAKNRRAEIIYR
jgi:peptidoglycan-associated lipoprotein